MKPTVLVVDDKPNMVTLLAKVLERIARVVTAHGVRSALMVLETEPVNAVLCDLRMPDGDGLDVLRATRARDPGVPFIITTAYASIPTAVQAMREGAYDFIQKPFDPDELRAIVERALAQVDAQRERLAAPGSSHLLLGQAPVMRAVSQLIEHIATTTAPVLVLGEPGTEHELVARTIHERSFRASSPFVTLSCSAPPRSLMEDELFGHGKGAITGAADHRPGALEQANRGTLLVADVDELRPSLQAKLSHAMQERAVRRLGELRERKVDVRVVATTHRDLQGLVKTGAFREDLWSRLSASVIELPPLRDRPEDIPLLARRFLRERKPNGGSGPAEISAEALAALVAYRWPGNLDELRKAVDYAAGAERGPQIRLGALPEEILHGGRRKTFG